MSEFIEINVEGQMEKNFLLMLADAGCYMNLRKILKGDGILIGCFIN